MKRNHLVMAAMIHAMSAILPSQKQIIIGKKEPTPRDLLPVGYGRKHNKMMRAFGFKRATLFKPNGGKECARRVKQMAAVYPNITMDQRRLA